MDLVVSVIDCTLEISVFVTLILKNGTATGIFSTSQPATITEDYSGTSPMTLEFSSSVVSITVPVTIVDDDIVENPETFSVVLTTADTDVFLQPDMAIVTINDNDSEFLL